MTRFFQRMVKVIQYAMPLFYLIVGLFLTFRDFLGEEVGHFKVTLGILLIGYSIFRAWRLYKFHQYQEENETSTD